MVNIITEISRFLLIILMALYTFSCFSVFAKSYDDEKKSILFRQNIYMFMIHGIAYVVMYLKTGNMDLIVFYGLQVIFFIAVILLYKFIYPKSSRLIVNNMLMLLSIGFIMITRLDFKKGFKQFVFVAAGMIISLIVPVIIKTSKKFRDFTYIYAGIGIAALLMVAVLASVQEGAKLGFTIPGLGISVQPSEFVKIIFVFYVASSFAKATDFKNIFITTCIAAAHVLILVLSTDLGAALIFFVVYLIMLYVATGNILYAGAGIGAGAVASVIGYKLFAHIKVRVAAWKDPLGTYNGAGYQVAQSLFAIGTGGWFGMGLYQGLPDSIPVAAEDFIFSAISEELGLIFALCLILVCLSCYVMFLNVAMQLRNQFYKLVALGLGTCYIFQVFLTLGGVTKFIPSTGVTLPLVSYGGSSILSSLIIFGIIQGLYILREDEEKNIEKRRNDVRGSRQQQKKAAKKRHKEEASFEEIPQQRIR